MNTLTHIEYGDTYIIHYRDCEVVKVELELIEGEFNIFNPDLINKKNETIELSEYQIEYIERYIGIDFAEVLLTNLERCYEERFNSRHDPSFIDSIRF